MPDAGRWEKRQKVLADFGEFALRSDDLDAVLTQACRLVAEALGTRHAKVLEIEHESRTLFVRAGVGWGEGIVGRLRLPMADHSSETYSIELGGPVITNDLATEDRFDFPAFLKDAGVRALANVPVFLPGGKPFGLLQVDASEPRVFDDDDSQFLRTYATILGPVIDRLLKVKTLNTAEARFRTIVEAARDYAIFQTDAQGRITDWLPGAEAVFGWTAEEAIGHPGAMLFTPEDRQAGAPEAETNGAREHGSAPDVRWHLRKDGGQVFIQGAVVALRGEAGHLLGFQKIGQDVTPRRLAEQALRESEEKYRTLFESIDEAFCVVEVLFDNAGHPTDYVFLETNAAFDRQTGLINAAGKRMRELAPDHERHWFEIFGLIAMSGEPQRFERPAEALGRWYDVYAFRIGEPEQRRVAILFHDVAERKRVERQLRESQERQAFLLSLSDTLRPLVDADQIQAATTRLLGANLGVDRAMYAEVTGERGAESGLIRGQYIRPAAQGRLEPKPFPDHFTYETFGVDVMARRYSGEGLAVADVNADPAFEAAEREAWTKVGVQAAIVAPLVKEGRLVAELGVHSETSRAWTDAEVSLVREVGERTWAAAERARAEAALRDSEQRYHSLFHSMDEAYAIVEVLKDQSGAWVDFRFIKVNPAFKHHTGVSDPVGRTATELLGTPNPRWAQLYGQALDTGEPLRVEESELTLGRTFDLNIFSLEPALNRVAVLFTDITQRKLAEAALRESEERFRLLVQNVRDYAIFTTDRDGLITSWPAGAAAVYGWSEAEMLGRSIDLTFLPEDVAEGVPAQERETAAREGLAPNVRWHLRKDGSRIFIDGSHQPLVGANGQIREFIKIGQDVTEVRRTQQALAEGEQRLRTLTEGIPQLVWRSADSGHWTWSSPQWQRFTGQNLAESLELGWLDAVHPEDRDAATQAWAGASSAGGIDVEYRVRRAYDDEFLWHHIRSLPVRNENGLIVEWLGTTTDVQQLKELQERQAVMVAELQHRTRNLIAVVRSIAQQTMAQTGPIEAFREEFGHRLEALARVQGLLSRSDEQPITIETLIRMELDALGGKTEIGRIETDGPSAEIRHSVVQTLALALHELATNARKYGALSNAEGRLAVRWRTYTDAKSERLALEWTETGGRPPKAGGDSRHGYGRELIEHALPYSLNAKTSFEHDDTSLRCKIDIPLKRTKSRRTAA